MIEFDLSKIGKENISIADDSVKTTNEGFRQLYLKFKKSFKKHMWRENLVNMAKFYLLYPYKKNSLKRYSNYIKKSDVSTHKYSITYEEYLEIITCFIKHLTLYLANGFTYRFTSGMGVLKIEKYKVNYLGHNLPKTLKKIQKEQGISYVEAKEWIKNNRDTVEFEERKNLLLKGYKFKLSWYNKDSNIPYSYYWYTKLMRHNNKKGGYQWFLDYFVKNPEAFAQINLREKKVKK